MPAHFIALYLYTHNRFRKGDILSSVSFHAVSHIYGCLKVSRFDSLYDTIYRMVIENCQEFRSRASEISSLNNRAMMFCLKGDMTGDMTF